MTQESRLVIVIDSKNAERNTRAVADELANLTTKGGQAESQMTAMSSSIKSLVGYMGGILTINKAIAMADGYTQMAARIRNATQSAEEYTLVQDRLLNTANTTYRALGEAQEVYLSMAGGMKSLGKSTKDTLDLTDSLSFSFTHNATRVDQAQSAMDALSKSMAKGKVDGDAWISIVTGADNVIADMAKTTGKTEAQIRKLGAEGKVSLEDLIKTLIATREQNEKLANNMENSLADGFTKLSNEVTVYLGKANEATSATGMLAGGLSTLADNLDLVANTGAALGIGYVTSALLTKGAAVKANMVLSAQQQIADRAELVSQTQLTAAEVRRTASLAQFTTMQLADAKATAARMTGMQRLAYVQSTVIPLEAKATQATAAHTAATAADTVAQEINNKARSRGAMLLGLIGGPIGAITLGVTALAAGYMYMSSRTDEANEKLEEQGKIAEKTNEELKKLTGNDKKSAVEDLTAAFAAQNIQLGKSKEAVDAVLFAIRAASVENEKARKVTEDARRGVISYDEAIKRLNEMDIPTDLYDMLKKQAKEYDASAAKANTSKVAFKAFGIEVKLAGNESQNASLKIAGNTKELNANETAAQKAARAQQGFKDSLYDREYEAYVTKGLLAKGYSESQVKAMVDAANYAKKEGIQITNEMYQATLKVVDIEQKNKDVIDARNKAQKENTNEITKQQKILQASAKVQANAAKYNFGGLESKYNLPNGMLSALHAIETGNSGKTNQVNKQSGATGGFQFLKGTADQYGVKDRTDMAQSAEGAAKYMSYLLKLFKGDLEKAVRAYHAGEGNVQKGKNIGKYNNDYWQKFKGYSAGANGYSAGDISSKDFEKILEDAAKLSEEQAKLRKSLELDVANEVTKIRENLKDKLEEIDKAGFSPEKAKTLKAEYQARAANDIAIANYALKTKLDDYEAFKKTESQLLEESFNERKFYAARDIELTKDQRDKAVALLDEQLKQEQAMLILAKETRIFQYKQALMTEAQAVRERYRIEMLELSKIVDIEERRIAMQAKTTAFIRGNLAPTGTPLIESGIGKSNTQLLQEETGKELLAMQNRYLAAQVAAKENAAELLRIEQDYIAAKEQLHSEHDVRLVDARQADYENQLQIYSQIAGMTAQVFDQMAGMLRESVGESNALYKTMFLAGRAASVAQAIVNTEEGATKALAQGGIYGSLLAGVIRATGYASVGLIAGQTIAGYKSGGYTGNYGTSDVAGVVHGQEYVLNAAATKRVGVGTLDAINSGKSMGEKAAVVQPVINIHTLPGETADVSMNGDGSLDVRIRKISEDHLVGQLSNPNSQASKTMKQNFNVAQRR
ncbi:hypothetical protein E0H80_06185 [Acinetobacter sp. ANC 4779]|uniref:tape measure protein n=1 Tax=Acinetobacter sp. ANC 4779 TaxID=2529848 RepID=UPI00103A7F50|nr:tape measure protein [Acinetobacter sp. ANC 4779]TCB50955.1 hypothetical protein E0H80_06185 [Acinetobacter sp. ANC 4779]